MKTKVAERGQITIPKVLRLQLGIRKGTVLNFEAQNGKLVGVKTEMRDPVAQVFGCLGKAIHTDTVMRRLRGNEKC